MLVRNEVSVTSAVNALSARKTGYGLCVAIAALLAGAAALLPAEAQVGPSAAGQPFRTLTVQVSPGKQQELLDAIGRLSSASRFSSRTSPSKVPELGPGAELELTRADVRIVVRNAVINPMPVARKSGGPAPARRLDPTTFKIAFYRSAQTPLNDAEESKLLADLSAAASKIGTVVMTSAE